MNPKELSDEFYGSSGSWMNSGHNVHGIKSKPFIPCATPTIEETFELADAITDSDWKSIREELGDLFAAYRFLCQDRFRGTGISHCRKSYMVFVKNSSAVTRIFMAM